MQESEEHNVGFEINDPSIPFLTAKDELLHQRLAFFELGAELADHCATIFEVANNDVKNDFKFVHGKFRAETERLWPLVNAILERKEVVFARNVAEGRSLFKEHYIRVIQMQHNAQLDNFYTFEPSSIKRK